MPVTTPISSEELEKINTYLSTLSPEQILQWAIVNLPNLYQTTAFGLTGLASIDMLCALTPSPPPLIFLDTLYHFPETLDLVERVKRRYGVPIHVYRPHGAHTTEEFESQHGYRLWERDEDSYDYLVKVEPARRAYIELNVQSVITGRRASQGADRSNLQPLEVDSTGLLKLNPFYAWTFKDVNNYVHEHNVPRNALLDKGYKSVGDWHSTKPAIGDQGERSGRWAGKEKTECGLHKDYFAMKILANKKKREEELRLKDEAWGNPNPQTQESRQSTPSTEIYETQTELVSVGA